jgi:predicted SAM-dependent methyltransferase
MLHRHNCTVCSGELNHIYSIPNYPINFSCVDTPQYKSIELSYSICKDCGTIQLDKLASLEDLYGVNHNTVIVGATWEKYFNIFASNIKELIKEKTILEVGCPTAKIASRSSEFKKWYIVQPNSNVNIENVEFIDSYFDDSLKVDNVDVIIHSHVFEHIYEPNSFLKKCNSILKEDGIMYFGVPNMEVIARDSLAPFCGVMLEHNIFYNIENISYLLKLNGFDIVDITEYEKHSIFFHCKKGKINKGELKVDIHDCFMGSLKYYETFIQECNKVISNSDKEVYIFGAGYNSQLILNMGLNIDKVVGILDNSKDKQGKFLYGTNLEIFSPSILKDKECIVILKNGYYSREIKEQLLVINKELIVIT